MQRIGAGKYKQVSGSNYPRPSDIVVARLRHDGASQNPGESKMFRQMTICAVVFFVGAASAQDPYGVLLIEGAPAGGIVSTAIDTAALQECVGAKPQPDSALCAALEHGESLVPLPLQCDTDADGMARLTLLLPEQPGPHRVRLDWNAAAASLSHNLPPLTVRQEGGAVIVNNGYAEVVHNPKAEAGLPSRVTMLTTGKVFDGFRMHDRLYEKDTGQFFLREDPDPTVRVLRAGPLEAVVEVHARYMAGDRTPDSAPEATYTFTYRAGTPAMQVTAHCTQQSPFNWHENHLMEWNIPRGTLVNWCGGTPRESGVFGQEEQQTSTRGWGALSDGTNVFGIASNTVRFYSGTSAYGGYVHGPWVSWGGTEQKLACTVWLDSAPDTVDQLEAHSAEPPGQTQVYVTTPAIEALRGDATARINALPKGKLRGLHRWWSERTKRTLLAQGDLIPARDAWQGQAEHLASGTDADVLLEALRKQVGAGMVQTNGEVLVLWEDAEHGASLASVFSLARERELLGGTPGPLWTLAFEQSPGKSHEWRNDSDSFTARFEGDSQTASIEWVGQGDAEGIKATVTSELEGPACELKLHVTNDSEQTSILEVRFPVMLTGPIGPDAGDDVVLQPTVSGKLVHAPLRKGLNFNANYPSGWGPLQFMAQYDADCGLYIGAHDPLASTKSLRGRVADAEGAVELAIVWPAPDASLPGNDFEHPGHVTLAAFEGDWFDACQIYRAWAEQEAAWWPHRGEAGRPDTPQWMREICIWTRGGGTRLQAVPPVKRFAEFMGVPTGVHWYTWHETPFDDNYPHYFPAKPEFAEGVAELQAAGVRVMPYINGRLWDADTDDFESVALPGATKGRDGKFYVERYGSGQDLVPMCPTQKVWYDKVHEIVLWLLGPECNVDGVYIDQIAAAAPRLCFDASHGHPLNGGHWWTVDGYWPMMTDLLQTMQEKYPQKMLTTECSAEPYLQCFDGYLTWHYQDQDAVPAVAAVCSGKVQMFGRAYNGIDQQAHRMKSAEALVFGEQLGWCQPGIIDGQPATAAHLRRCARMRHQLLPHLAEGRMMRPPKVTGGIPQVTADWAWSGKWLVTDSALQCGAWKAEDGSVAFVFASSVEEALNFTWHFDGGEYGLTGTSRSAERVTETSREPIDPVATTFERKMNLEPLGVIAIVVK
jgi:Domain of unknown function (DUF6259)